MAKRPKDLPSIGDRVEMRYRGEKIAGILRNMNSDNEWASVDWGTTIGPTICHLFELKRITG